MVNYASLKTHYNTVLCQALSSDGRYLVAGNIYGDISVYDVSSILSPQDSENTEIPGPHHHFKAYQDQAVQSMVETKNFLITASYGEITGWDWKIVASSKASKIKPCWSIQIPYKKDNIEKPDVNCLKYSKENHLLYIGSGDNKIHIADLEYGKIVSTLEGHENYIHSLALSGNQIASGSEDGTVRLWDIRKKENTNILQPHLHDKVTRPKLGKWIGAVDFTEDWLLCGGGPKLSLWHMRSMEAATSFDLPDQGIHVAEIYEDRVIAGGLLPCLYHLTFQANTLAKVPVSSSTVYSVVHREEPNKLLSVGGSSNLIDLCTNFNYRELVLKFM